MSQEMNIGHYGQLMMMFTFESAELEPNKLLMNSQLSPVVTEENEGSQNPADWIALHYAYVTQQRPSTRLQITFAEPEYQLFPLDSQPVSQAISEDAGRFRTEWLSQFDVHPDPLVKVQLLGLTSVLEKEGYEERGIDWTQQFLDLDDRKKFSGLQGLFFPLLHFYHPDTQRVVVVRCEPVLEVRKED